MPLLLRPLWRGPAAASASSAVQSSWQQRLLLLLLGASVSVLNAQDSSDVASPQDRRPAPPAGSHCLLQRATSSVTKAGAPTSARQASAPPPREHAAGPAALVAVGSNSSRGSRRAEARRQSGGLNASTKDVPASWFGGYSKAESTYDVDGVGDYPDYPERIAARVSEYGNSVNMEAQKLPDYLTPDGLPSEWFEESDSAGPHAAWRTRFPALEAFRSEGVKTVPWLPDPNGRRARTSLPADATIADLLAHTQRKAPAWFDDAVRHYDDFGRNRPPGELSDRRYWDWEKKTYGPVQFGCPNPGCIANFSLKTFDAKALQHSQCMLSIGVHATDYDDQYSREYVEWFVVNGFQVNSFCDPMAKGCNKSVPMDSRGLHPCVTDYPIDQMLREGTDLTMAGKITEMVDECPVNKNLLSGKASVTCWVKPWDPVTTTLPPKLPNETSQCAENTTKLQCHEHGCSASALTNVCKLPQEGEKCLMDVWIWHTDFDNDHGSVEVVEWIKVNGKEVAKNLMKTGGRNPCKEVYDGKPPTQESLMARGSQTTPEPLSLDAQTRALLATVPDDASMQEPSCRRRLWNMKQKEARSFLDQADDEPSHRRRGKPPLSVVKEYDHLRAAPDKMEYIVKGKDITEEVRLSGGLRLEGKISDRVDECAKDGYLLNMEATVTCGTPQKLKDRPLRA